MITGDGNRHVMFAYCVIAKETDIQFMICGYFILQIVPAILLKQCFTIKDALMVDIPVY